MDGEKMLSMFKEQPRAFSMIFFLELWERFGFYTVQGILTLYFIRLLGFSDIEAYYTFGAFSALVYGLVVVGGYLGDKILGTKRTLLLGLLTLNCGYLALTFSNEKTIFLALAIVAVGNGLFKANPSSLLSKCYAPNDARLHGGFTLYYMSINLGSMVALILGPALASSWGYPYAYLTSFMGLAFGLLTYHWNYQTIAPLQTGRDEEPVSIWVWLLVVLGILFTIIAATYLLHHVQITQNLVWLINGVVLLLYFYYMSKESKASALRMMVALILMLEGIVFFTLYQQMPTSLNLFAVNNVRSTILGFTLDPQSFQALNPIWIVILSPILVSLYRRSLLAVPYKFALGMVCCGISFTFLYFARFFADEAGMVSSLWLIVSYFFQSAGELLVSALGVAMVAELVPPAIVGFVMGAWFLTSAVSGFTGAWVASLTALPLTLQPGLESLKIYTQVFAHIGLWTLGIGILMWLAASRLNSYITTVPGQKSGKNHEKFMAIRTY